MRKMCIVLLTLLAQGANATLFFSDSFNYTDGANLGSAAGGAAETPGYRLLSGAIKG